MDLEPTVGELSRRLDHVDAVLEHIHTEMISHELYEAHRHEQRAEIKRIHHRLDEMKADRQWMLKLIFTVLITALANLAVQILSS